MAKKILKKEPAKELSLAKQQIIKAEAAVNDLVVKDDLMLARATDLLSKVKAVGRIIKKEREDYTRPAKEIIAKAKSIYDPMEERVKWAESQIKSKMIAYQTAKEEKIRADQEKLAARVEKGTMKMETAVAKVGALEETKQNSVFGDNGGRIQFREIRKVIIENPDLVPDEYWIIDEVRVRRDALAGKEIAGVKVITEKSVASN